MGWKRGGAYALAPRPLCMERNFITVRVESETRSRIEAQLAPDESADEWVREAIHRRLDADESGEATTWPDEFVDDCGI